MATTNRDNSTPSAPRPRPLLPISLQEVLVLSALGALVAVAITVQFIPVANSLKLVLPVIALGLTGRILGFKMILLALVALVAGLAAAVITGTLPLVKGLITGAVVLLLGIVSCAYRPAFRGAYGLSLRTEREILAALLEAVPVVLLDKKGRVRRASAACPAIFGLERQQLKGMAFSDLVQGFDHTRHAHSATPCGNLIAEHGDWQAQRVDNPPMPVDLWLDHTDQGPLIRLVDLTPRHVADAQARELHSQLNKVWRLNSLGEMAATLAHELNQPLGAAAAYIHAAQSDMKQAGPLGESALRTSELAKAQMLRAGQIIRRMRELLTMEMRALSKEHVSRVVDDVLPILVLTGKDTKVTIRTEIAEPDIVRMDRIQVQQALVNLVRNAVEACPEDGQVLITGQVINDRSYEIAVEDNGQGIAPDKIESVFQPMTTTKSGGMGLGLSVTRTIVESHGGHLSVGVSRWGGARFSFTLTVANQDNEE